MSVNRATLALALLVLGFVLAACGKKAGRLDPPPDVENDKYPMTYPDSATDPKPEPAPRPQ
jgi:predicted small lipoprotein YifL